MNRIASTHELQIELTDLIRYARTYQPSRVRLARDLLQLSRRLAMQGLKIEDIKIGDRCKTLVYGKMTEVVVLDIKPRGESRPWAHSTKEAIKVRPVNLNDGSFQIKPANELFPD